MRTTHWRPHVGRASPQGAPAREDRRTGPLATPTAGGRVFLYGLFCLIVATTVLGGLNTNEASVNIVLHYVAAPILCAAIFRLAIGTPARDARRALWVLSLFLLAPLLQLIPLPEGLWRRLPYHDVAAGVLSLLGAPQVSRPLSLAPFLTWVSFLTLLPALAIFVGVLTLEGRERREVVGVFLIATFLGAFLGLLQFSQNSGLGAYLYPGMSAGDVVGFFANRNHFAVQMCALAPFAVAFMVIALSSTAVRRSGARLDILMLFMGGAALFVLVVVGVMARSRAGVVLLMVSLLASACLPRWRDLRQAVAVGDQLPKLIPLLAGSSLLFALEFGFFRLLARFEADPLQDARIRIAKNTYDAALTAWPTGTGYGTFRQIYGAIEPTHDVVPLAFVNHAHNDYLELLLEGGAPALVMIAAFLAWFFWRVRNIWRAGEATETVYLARAASIAIGLLLLHSFVDYPLRTQALMGLFAMSCALLIPAGNGTTPPSRRAGAQAT